MLTNRSQAPTSWSYRDIRKQSSIWKELDKSALGSARTSDAQTDPEPLPLYYLSYQNKETASSLIRP